tara:strand:+ start:4306 stop:4923 length:618 start_codon:yes stop_codon:yes gene_type:complete
MNEAVNTPDSVSDEGEVAWLKKQLGEQGNEIGRLRSALEAKVEEQDRQLMSESFDSDQISAMERLVEQKTQPLREELNQTRSQAAEAKLIEKHPDYQQVLVDPKFAQWVQSSKRNSVAYEAAIAGDLDTGIELLDAFKSEARPTPSQDTERAALASGRAGSGDAGVRDGGVLLRSEIQELRRTDPAGYRARLPEITKAYAEGRVR